jgi:hypothetical protein
MSVRQEVRSNRVLHMRTFTALIRLHTPRANSWYVGNTFFEFVLFSMCRPSCLLWFYYPNNTVPWYSVLIPPVTSYRLHQVAIFFSAPHSLTRSNYIRVSSWQMCPQGQTQYSEFLPQLVLLEQNSYSLKKHTYFWWESIICLNRFMLIYMVIMLFSNRFL